MNGQLGEIGKDQRPWTEVEKQLSEVKMERVIQ